MHHKAMHDDTLKYNAMHYDAVPHVDCITRARMKVQKNARTCIDCSKDLDQTHPLQDLEKHVIGKRPTGQQERVRIVLAASVLDRVHLFEGDPLVECSPLFPPLYA